MATRHFGLFGQISCTHDELRQLWTGSDQAATRMAIESHIRRRNPAPNLCWWNPIVRDWLATASECRREPPPRGIRSPVRLINAPHRIQKRRCLRSIRLNTTRVSSGATLVAPCAVAAQPPFVRRAVGCSRLTRFAEAFSDRATVERLTGEGGLARVFFRRTSATIAALRSECPTRSQCGRRRRPRPGRDRGRRESPASEPAPARAAESAAAGANGKAVASARDGFLARQMSTL
jgi:hypothetical protein